MPCARHGRRVRGSADRSTDRTAEPSVDCSTDRSTDRGTDRGTDSVANSSANHSVANDDADAVAYFGTVNITGTEVSLATVTLIETPGLRQLRLAISRPPAPS